MCFDDDRVTGPLRSVGSSARNLEELSEAFRASVALSSASLEFKDRGSLFTDDNEVVEVFNDAFKRSDSCAIDEFKGSKVALSLLVGETSSTFGSDVEAFTMVASFQFSVGSYSRMPRTRAIGI